MTRVRLLTTDDADCWRAALPAAVCPMGSVEYARIQERHTGHPARLFVVESGATVIAYPFFLRPIELRPLAAGPRPARWDTYTAEYTGPVRVGPPLAAEERGRTFAELFGAQCRELGVVAEFAHLNPWTFAPDLFDPACVELNREIVQVDLGLGEDGLWRHALNSDARRQVRQADRAGVHVRRARSLDDVRELHRLYELTMERRSASERHRLPLQYFVALHETMPENALLVVSEYRGRIVAGGVYFQGGTDLYWHLSAADLDFSRVRPVDAYVHHTMRAAARAGMRRMLCGGGCEPGDSLFHFKAKFSPLRAEFRVYKRVHDPRAYAALARAWSGRHGAAASSFFPAYRAPPVAARPEDAPAAAAVAGVPARVGAGG